jgi:hypothetical protein
VDQDPDRAFGAAEDTRDLRRRHLVDKSKNERSPPIAPELPDRAPGGAGLLAPDDITLDVERVRDDRRLEDRLARPSADRPLLVRDDVPGDLEQPDAEGRGAFAVGRPSPLLEAVQVRERGQERPLRGVLGGVVIAELVVGVAVHAGQVPPIEGIEACRIALRRLDQRSIQVEVRDAGLGIRGRSRSPEHRTSHAVTPVRRRGDAESRPRGRAVRGRQPPRRRPRGRRWRHRRQEPGRFRPCHQDARVVQAGRW